MSLKQSFSKHLPGVLLVLLIICVLLIFGSYHNLLITSGVKATPVWAIIFLLVVILVGVNFFTLQLRTRNTSRSIERELQLLKSSIEESKRKEVKVEEVVKNKFDVEKEVKAIIPDSNDSLAKFGELLLTNISRRFEIVQGQLYMKDQSTGVFSFVSGYAYFSEKEPITYKEGETLAGQAAKNKTVLNLNSIPDNHITILSGLGKGSPKHLLIAPIITTDNETIGIFELASFKAFDSEVEKLFAYLGHKLGERLAQPSKQ